MSLLKLCGLVILAAVLLLLLRETGGKLSGLAAALGGLLLLGALVDRYGRLFSFLTSIEGGETLGEALSLSLRVLAISFLTEVTAGICRDLGESGLAARLEWCGRAEILVVSLPTLARLLETAVAFLG